MCANTHQYSQNLRKVNMATAKKYTERVNAIINHIEIEELAANCPANIAQADDCDMRLASLRKGALQLLEEIREERNLLVNRESALNNFFAVTKNSLVEQYAIVNPQRDPNVARIVEDILNDAYPQEFAAIVAARHQLSAISEQLDDIIEAHETLGNYLTPETVSVSSDELPFESAPQETAMQIFDRLVKKHPQDVVDYIVRHRDIRAQTPDEELDEVLAEISRGRVNTEDVMQSLDEVLNAEYAGFFETLNRSYSENPNSWNEELYACVEAYAE